MNSLKKKSSYIALIPLRGGSKSIPKKNIKLIGGKPLCAWTLEAAVNACNIDKVYVSTDCSQIRAVVLELGLGVTVIERPAQLATDDASTESVMLHFMQQIPFDYIITIQATSPLLTAQHINEAQNQFKEECCDSMLSAVRSKRFYWNDDATPINYDPMQRPRRQDFKGTLMENGAFYITKRKILEQYQCRLGGKIGLYEMPEDTAVEIDEPEDWQVVSRLLEHSQERK